MLKNSNSNNNLNLNKKIQFPVSEKRNLIIKNNNQKYNQKKKTKIIKSNSLIKYKESDIKNNKQIILSKRNSIKNKNKNKYTKINTINENKEKNKNNVIKNKNYNSNKNLKNNLTSKENKNNINNFSSRKNSLPKQISFVSKISNDDLPKTIDNDNEQFSKNIENKNIKISNFQYNKKNINNKKNNIYDYQINQLKQILIKKQNIKNNIEKILSNKFKNLSSNSNNKSKNFSNIISKTNNNLIKTNINSFSPIQKNNSNLYKISSQSKKNIFSNTNPNINCNLENNNINSNSQKYLNNNKNIIKNKNKNNNISQKKFLNKKMTEKSCPILNIDYMNIKNIQESYINDENLIKNSISHNIILRNTSGPNLNNPKGALKPFCSLINIPYNNKEKKENNDKNNSNYSISNENINYFFDKNKYFNDFKNKINLNINNLFFKLKRKNTKNIYYNISKNNDYKEPYIKKSNYLSEENNGNKNNNNFNEKTNPINNILTEKINKKDNIKIDKIVRIKKIKSINLINNTNKCNSENENEKEDFILNDLFIKKRNGRKKLTDNIESNIINSTNSTNIIYTKTNNKNSFTSFNRKSINDNNKKNYNSYFINVNNTNGKGRNDNNILNNNIFEPQTTVYKKNYFYKTRINNTNSSSNRNIYTQKYNKNGKSLTVFRNKKEKNENKSVITSSRNKNIEKEILNNDKNETNYLKIIKLFDELRKYKKSKKYKKKELEICFLNNSSNNSNNNYFDGININRKEKKRKMKIEIDENKVKENISQNTLTMYTIYILSKYYNKCKKVGLRKIIIFDKNGNTIPVICFNSNSNLSNRQSLTNNNLFNSSNRNNNFSNKSKDSPFIMEFKKNLYINFYIKHIKSNSIDFIQIINYSDIKNDISSIKNIQIFKGNHLIYKGILTEKNPINKIPLHVNNNNKKYSSMINQNSKNMNIDNIKQRPLSSSKTRSCNNILLTKASTYRKSEVNEYYTKRNIFKNSNQKNYIFSDNNYNETNYIDKRTKAFIYNTKKHSASDILNKNLLTGYLGQELNISNTCTFNNLTNNPQKTYYGNGDKFLNYNDISGNNRYIEQKLFYNSIKNNYIKLNYNLSNISNSQNQKNEKPKIINEYDNNLQRKGDKIFMKSNSEKKFKKSIIKTQKSLLFQKINEENDNDLNINNNNETNYNSKKNDCINNNNNMNKKYIEFNKIRLVLTSNYGHSKYIGLTGIIFYNLKGDPINIETASSIGALPKDLKTILDDDNENRIFENIFNGNNNTNESDNMWVTKFKKKPPLTFIELYFQDRIRVSRIKIYNYNEKNRLEIGVKTIDIYLDDEFYKTIFIRQGIGESVNDFITLNNDTSSSIEDFDKYKNYDFGQNFTFPIKDEKNKFYNSNMANYEFNKINNTTYINLLNNKIKYASFLYEQSYETPYLPCGYYVQIQFCSSYYKGSILNIELEELKYNDIGLGNIEIYDNKGKNVLLKNDNTKNKYKLLSNCEINHNESNQIILNVDNRNYNNSIFYVFEKNIQISYIKFYPLIKNENGKEIQSNYSLKEAKVFCETNIIFEGDLYLNHPTIILFTCDTKIVKNINEKYLTKNIKNKNRQEIFKKEYISLVLN